MVELYLDSANLEEMALWAPKIAGITTNPSLMRKAGVTDYKAFALEAVKFGKPISFEVIASDPDGVQRQAEEIASWGENVFVKVPIVYPDGVTAIGLIRSLGRQKIKVNVTAVMHEGQVGELASMLGRGTEVIVSIFAGRIADTWADPLIKINYAKFRLEHMKNVKILWASTRESYNIKQAIESKVDIITVTADLLAKQELVGKDLAEFSRETSQMFYNDAQKAGYTL